MIIEINLKRKKRLILLVPITQIINSVGKMQLYSDSAAAFVSDTICLCFSQTSRSFQ